MRQIDFKQWWMGMVGLIYLGWLLGGCESLQSSEISNQANPHLAAAQASINRVLVKFKDTLTSEQREAILTRHDLKEESYIQSIGVTVLTVPSHKTPQQVVIDLQTMEHDSIEYAEPDAVVSIPEPPP